MTKPKKKEAAPDKPKRKQLPPSKGTVADYWAFLPQHKYWYMPTRKLIPAESVNSLFGPQTSITIDRTRATQEATWCPGQPAIIMDKLVVEGGWIDKAGANTFNLYIPPRPIVGGDPDKADKWRAHGEKLWGDYLPHIEKWLAFKVQHPEIKINHAIVTGSLKHGIGKDTYMAPLKRAVGVANFKDVSARRAFNDAADKNSFLQSVILRINEVHDLGEKRFAFYDITKEWMAAPPETIQVSDKWVTQHPIFNVVGVDISTNHKTDGLYLDPNDRRHYVAWSEREPEDFYIDGDPMKYWNDLWDWYKGGGFEHVAAYLAKLNLTDFDPKAPPPKTQAWWDIVHANQKPEDASLSDVLDYAGQDFGVQPDVFTLDMLKQWAAEAPGDTRKNLNYLFERGDSRIINHRLDHAQYTPVRNDLDKRDGLWRFAGKRRTVYARSDMTVKERCEAVQRLIAREERRHARTIAHSRSAANSNSAADDFDEVG